MFRSTKHNKPLAQVLREKNSRNKFVNELTKNEEQLFNRSLDSVQTAILEKKPNLKQTKLYIRRSLKRPQDQLNDSFSSAEQMQTKTELFIMPSPKMKVLESKVKLNNTVCGEILERSSCANVKPDKESDDSVGQPILAKDIMTQVGHNLQVLVGNVNFVLKIMKIHPNINVLWDVYGKIHRISKGKIRYEKLLLMRNSDGEGPILQCVYYDFDNKLESYDSESNVRVVGHFNIGNRLRVFKIDFLKKSVNPIALTRIQNVNTFVLLQNQTSINNK